MARNGSGTYSLAAGNPVANGTDIVDTWANATLSDIAAALTQSIAADGQTPITANIPMNGKKLTGLGAGTSAGDALSIGQTGMGLIDGSGGVKVGNSAVADTSTLDFYLENNYTPTIAGTTTAGTASYSVQSGTYTRIGNRVLASLKIAWSGATGTGNVRIVNALPIAVNASAVGLSAYGVVGAGAGGGLNGANCRLLFSQGQTFADLFSSGDATSAIAMSATGSVEFFYMYQC